MTLPESIGQHALHRRGDLVTFHIHGSLTRPDLVRLREALADVIRDTGRCFLVADLGHATGIDTEARRYMTEWSRQNTDWIAGTAVHGVNFALRALLTLTLKAIKLVGTQQVEFVFVKDEPEALRWIAARRLALFPDTTQP